MSAADTGPETLPLIRTKLHTPRVTGDLVPRPRLVERLNKGLDRRLAKKPDRTDRTRQRERAPLPNLSSRA